MTTMRLYRGQSADDKVGQFWTTSEVAAAHYATGGWKNEGLLLTLDCNPYRVETDEHILCDGPEACLDFLVENYDGDFDEDQPALVGPDSIMGAVSDITGVFIPDASEWYRFDTDDEYRKLTSVEKVGPETLERYQ